MGGENIVLVLVCLSQNRMSKDNLVVKWSRTGTILTIYAFLLYI